MELFLLAAVLACPLVMGLMMLVMYRRGRGGQDARTQRRERP